MAFRYHGNSARADYVIIIVIVIIIIIIIIIIILGSVRLAGHRCCCYEHGSNIGLHRLDGQRVVPG